MGDTFKKSIGKITKQIEDAIKGNSSPKSSFNDA